MAADGFWAGRAGGRWTRRAALARAGAAGIGLAALGCGGKRRSAPAGSVKGTAAAAQPQQGGYLRHLASYSAGNIDPATTEDSTAYGFVETDWYDPLTRIQYTPGADWRIANKVLPWLAVRFEQVDPLTYTFTIRPGVTFQNGDGLTAQDVLFSFQRIRDPATRANPNVRTLLSGVDTIEAPDDASIRLTTKLPSADFLAGISGRNVPVVSKRFVEGGGNLSKTALGTGPFKLTSYQKDGNALALRFANAWVKPRPYLDGIKIVLKTDDSTASAAFSTGDADFVILHDRKEADPIQKERPAAATEAFPVEEIHGLVFNQTKPPFSDPRVRMAVQLAIDRQAADKAVNFGEGYMSGPIVVAGKTGWGIATDQLLKLPGYRQPKAEDIAEAKRLLAAAGYGSGLKTSIGFPSTNAYAPNYAGVLQGQLAQIGIKADILGWDNATYTQRRVQPNYDLAVVSEGSLATPSTAAFSSFYSTGVYARPAGISDPDLDKLIDAQAAEFDFSKRGAIFDQIERAILEKAYKAPISTPRAIRLNQPWVHDWVDNRSAHQTIMNPEAIWIDVGQAPSDRRQST